MKFRKNPLPEVPEARVLVGRSLIFSDHPSFSSTPNRLSQASIYRSKGGKKENVFDALEWVAAMCSHVPNKGEQMVR